MKWNTYGITAGVVITGTGTEAAVESFNLNGALVKNGERERKSIWKDNMIMIKIDLSTLWVRQLNGDRRNKH